MILRSALVFILLTLFCGKSLSVEYPSVPCPYIFRYVNVGDLDMGLLTLKNVRYGETTLELELSQPGEISPGIEGYLNLNIDEDQVSEYIRTGRPITYKVNFPLKNVVPQVSAIRVNGNIVCYGQRVPEPSTTIMLKQTLRAFSPFNSRQPQSFNTREVWPVSQRISNQYPSVPCPYIFRYVNVGDLDMGLITIKNVNYGETVLELELSQPGTIPPGIEGYLNLNIDENQVSEYIRTGRPITYKVNFPLKNVVPQVSAIRVNGNIVCYGQRVPEPSTTITLTQTLRAFSPFNSRQPQSFNRREVWPVSQRISNQYPSVPCPNIFRYVNVGDLDMGLITIENVNYGETVLELELSQPGTIPPGFEGYLNLNFEENKIFEYIRSRTPITYKVNFPLKNVIPQVSAIRLNGNTICYGQRVGAPSTTMTLKHTITAPNASPQLLGNSRERNFLTPMTSPWRTHPNGSQPYFGTPNFLSPAFTRPNEVFPHEVRNPFRNRNNGFQNTNAPPQTTTERPSPQLRTSSPTTTSTTPSTTTPSSSPVTTNAAKPEGPATLEYINSVCGRENFNFTSKKLAVNGESIPRARFPWIVAIYTKTVGTLSFQCGGSLISTRTVISAAHCFYTEFDVIKNEDILISLGRHNLTDWSDSYIIHSDVEKIIRHPDYRPELINIDADLAIIRLKNTVTFSQAIRPVCLWQGPLNVRDIEGVSGIVVGWGRDENNSSITTSPRLVTASVASEITCIRSNQQLFYLTSNRTLCAGNRDGTGPCNGDSGSGLMIRNRNKWMLRGTVSAALSDDAANQCNLEEYVVYTDIAMFLGWIKDNMLL